MKYRIIREYDPSPYDPKLEFKYSAQRKSFLFWKEFNWSYREDLAQQYIAEDFKKRGGHNKVVKEYDYE